VRGISGAGHGGGERHQLHEGEIGPDRSGALRRGEQGKRSVEDRAVPGRDLRRLAVGPAFVGGRERVREHAAVRDVGDERAKPFPERIRRLPHLRQLRGRGAELANALVVDGLDQVSPGPEVPVERGVPHPGRPGDVVE